MTRNTVIIKPGDYVIAMHEPNIYAGQVIEREYTWSRIKYLALNNIKCDDDFYNLENGEAHEIGEMEFDTFLKVSKTEYNRFAKMSKKEKIKYCNDRSCIIGEVMGHAVREICGHYIFGCGAVILTEKELNIIREGYEALANVKLPKEFVKLKNMLEDEEDNLLHATPEYIY